MKLNFWPFNKKKEFDYIPATLWFYELSGKNHTTVPLTVYQDKECTIPHPFPIVGTTDGMFPFIYLDETPGYLVIKNFEGYSLSMIRPSYDLP